MKKFLVLTLVVVLSAAVAVAKPEKLTKTITWELTPDGTLLISGRGAMPDFDYDKKKCWLQKKYDGLIRRIVVGEGISSIGKYNFKNMDIYGGNAMKYIEEVTLPSSLREIGSFAFDRCGVAKVNFAEGLVSIGYEAFEDCHGLTELKLPATLQTIYSRAFIGCDNIKTVNFSGAHVALCADAFKKCMGITSIENGENVQFGKLDRGRASSFETVFTDTKVTEAMLRGEKEETPALAQATTGEFPAVLIYETDYKEGDIVYGGAEIIMSFVKPDPLCKFDKMEAPYGYYQYSGEGGDELIAIFSDVKLSGNTAEFTATKYSYEYSSDGACLKAFEKEKWMARYNPVTGSCTVAMDAHYKETFTADTRWKNEVGPEVFRKGNCYVAEIFDMDWNPIGSRGLYFEKMGDKILMFADEIYTNGRIHGSYYALGKVDGRRILFDRGVYDQGGLAGADYAYLAGDYKTLFELMEPAEDIVEYKFGNILYYDEVYLPTKDTLMEGMP